MGYYYQLYDIVHHYIYGGVELTTYQDLTATLLSTVGSVCLVALPFFCVYWICKFITTLGSKLM